MLVAERFIRSLVSKYGKHTVYTDGITWYHEACNVLTLKHYLHSSFEKSLIESTNILRIELKVLMTTIYVCKMDASPIQPPIQPPSPSLPTNLSDQTIGNKGDNDVSILLGNGDGTFTSTASDVVVGDATILCCSRTL